MGICEDRSGSTVDSAEQLNETGRALSHAGDISGAVAAYRAAIDADGSWSVPWYNLGLLYKYQAEWSLSLECNREALVRDGADEDAWWNLGIAATALSDWTCAREAWSRCGVLVPAGTGPIQMQYGLVPIRLNPDGRGEVIWGERIDPARAIIRNVPLPESGCYYGDLMLHDGAPEGYRLLEGREVPVFNALIRLERSTFRTYILDLPQSTKEDRSGLCDVADELGRCAEDWSESVKFLCKQCSYGLPHERHDADLKEERPKLAVAVAARDDDDVSQLLELWRERCGYAGYAGFVAANEK